MPPGRHALCRLATYFGPVAVVEDVEQRAVDDGVVARPVCQVHRVGDLESRADALGLGIAAGLFDGLRREVDARPRRSRAW